MNMKTMKLLTTCFCVIFLMMACGEGKKKADVTGADGTVYTSYQDACRNADFNAAYKIIELTDGTEEDKDYVFNAEMLYLVSQNTEETSNRVLYLLAEYQIPGTPVSPGAEYSDKDYRNVKKYMEGISRYNNRCNSVLSLAISQRNETLARKVVELFKQNVDVASESSDIGKKIEISSQGYNNTDKDAAKRRLEEAIKEGAFKKSE